MSGCSRPRLAGDSPRANASWMARTTSTFCLEIRGHLPANCAFSSVVGDGGYVVMTSPATSPTPPAPRLRGRAPVHNNNREEAVKLRTRARGQLEHRENRRARGSHERE